MLVVADVVRRAIPREAVGHDGEQYTWTHLHVVETVGGLLTAACIFDEDDESGAFAYAEERCVRTTSRLAVTNQSCEMAHAITRGLKGDDVDAIMECCADNLVFDDRRRLSGDPIHGSDQFRTAWQRILQQYSHFDQRILAVRGAKLNMSATLWSDDSGNETAYLHVQEIDDDGLLVYAARFDEDDFEGAYRELSKRYYSGEAAAFADNGAVGTEFVMAYDNGDFDRLLGELATPGMRFENRSHSVIPDRSIDEFRASIEQLSSMVSSARTWNSAECWLAPDWCITRFEREAVGKDGQPYKWTWIYVTEFRNGLVASSLKFDLENEEQAFAYIEEQVRAAGSRLAVTNRASRTAEALADAMNAADLEATLDCFSGQFVYDDRRQLSGDPLHGRAELRAAATRILQQYNHFEARILAVRGEHLSLDQTRWANDAGFETIQLSVNEVDDDGQIAYQVRFDEDDFVGAYRELERRYYAVKGAAFADAGATSAEYAAAVCEGDLDRAFGELTSPDFHIVNRSRSIFGDRSAAEFRASIEELNVMVASTRMWDSAVHWLSPSCCVARSERDAVGEDGEHYAWTHLSVTEIRDGQFTSACLFDVDDEEAAFAYAEERGRAKASRLPLSNRATLEAAALWKAMRARDIDSVMDCCSDRLEHDDRRRLSGGPLRGSAAIRRAMERIVEQYTRFEIRTLAVRGESLHLYLSRWSNEADYQTAYLHVSEIGDDGRFIYEGRFDEDDFESAYRELDSRYYAGEGAAFADQGPVLTEWQIALNQGDFDRLFDELTAPDLCVENRSSSVFGDRSAIELRASIEELDGMVASARSWHSNLCWLSRHWVVARIEREAVGLDDERYSWSWLDVYEFDGRLSAACRFELDDEDAALAYAEEQIRVSSRRLPVANRATRTTSTVAAALLAGDPDGAADCFSEEFVYDDRRRISGDPIRDRAQLRTACERILLQYNKFNDRILAVRGENLTLGASRWSNDSRYETTQLAVNEVDDDGRIIYQARFDGDDFEGAYRELDKRYYTGEGSAFAGAGVPQTEWQIAMNQGDLDSFFEHFSPDMRFDIKSRSVFPGRTTSELRASLEELYTWVATMQAWHAAMRWLSPTCCVTRTEREAVGRDGEQYAWTRLYVLEFRDGRCAASCEFELDDEDAAFAYAEELVRAAASRMAVSNWATQTGEAVQRAMNALDADAVAAYYSDALVYDDRRRLAGNPFPGMRTAAERVFAQYTQFEARVLAVRGERLFLGWMRWSNEAGYETSYLTVQEIGDDGRFIYQARFDEDDFEAAYRELTRRYCAGEGAAFADAAMAQTEWLLDFNKGDFDHAFSELIDPEARMYNRSRSAFPDRSAAELRASLEELNAMVTSARTWNSVERWLSPRCCVCRNEREATGHQNETFAWTRLYVVEVHDGRGTATCEFDPDDEDAAFTYAEERVRAANRRLAVANSASRTFEAAGRAMQGRDVDTAAGHYAASFLHDDRRRFGGNPIGDVRTAQQRILEQYNHFEGRTLAVRGERLHLGWTRWSNESGFETCYLIVHEVDESGRFIYEGRFDEDDFNAAYRELERRYCAGEGAPFAEMAALGAEYLIALNEGDFDRLFNELTDPDTRVANRTRTGFPDRSVAEFRASYEELHAMVGPSRSWNSAECWLSPTSGVVRSEREAFGQDGEHYAWTKLVVFEFGDGRCTGLCEFELEDEAAAFTYAEERVRGDEPG